MTQGEEFDFLGSIGASEEHEEVVQSTKSEVDECPRPDTHLVLSDRRTVARTALLVKLLSPEGPIHERDRVFG